MSSTKIANSFAARSLISVGLLLMLWAQPSAAAPPPTPVQGSDFQALQIFVGDPLRGLEAGDAGSLFGFGADSEQHMASTTKSFTLLLAVEAVLDGTVGLDDAVTISWKAANIDFGHSGSGQNTHTEADVLTGQQIRFEDLLYAMMLPSGGDASIAIAQHVAVSSNPIIDGSSDFYQELTFVDMMNERAAELGLADTYFYNPYGGDHEHWIDNTPGDDIPHASTPRDMVKWFDLGMQYDLFRQVAGFQGTWSFGTLNDGALFSFDKSFAYPGIEGAKPGGGGGCGSCMIAQTKRTGRELLVAYTEGQGGDGASVLDYGFEALFHPTALAESAEWTNGWIDNDIACMSPQRAATAVVRPNGEIAVLLWDVDIDAGSIEHLNPIVNAVDSTDDFAPATRSGGGGDRTSTKTLTTEDSRPPTKRQLIAELRPTSETPDSTTIYKAAGEPAHAVATRIAYIGAGNLAVVAETDQGIWLHSYGITQSDTVVLRDSAFVGDGSLARVMSPQQTLLVTAHRDDDDALVIRSWGFDPVSGLLSNALDTYVAGDIGDELEMAGRLGLAGSYHVVTFARSTSGTRVLRSWDVTHITGDITALDSLSPGGSSTRLAVSHVTGFEDDRDIYAAAFRNSVGQLSVEAYEFETNGDLTSLGSTADTLGGPLASNATIKLAAYREGGVMLAIQPNAASASQQMETWSLDPSGTTNSITPNRIAFEAIARDGLNGICRVPGNDAEGDFLVSHGAVAVNGIRIQGWRSAPRD